MEKFLRQLINYFLPFFLFIFPLFFLPFTQEFFLTNKLYFMAFSALFVLLISNIQYLISKKLSWKSLPTDLPVILFLITIGLSIIFSSPNKIQALLNSNFGLVLIFSLSILYFYLSRSPLITQLLNYLTTSSFILSLIVIVFFFQPFKNINFPQNLQFLKNPYFTPVGSQIDLAIFLGFFVLSGLIQVITQKNKEMKAFIFNFSLLIFNLIALSLTLYNLFRLISTNSNQLQSISITLPPFRLSWYAAIEVLKNPLTALFGVGVDNFSSVFTRVKDIAYNQSTFWQINSFVVSRSTILHILTEAGIFSLLAFAILLFNIYQSLINTNSDNKLLLFQFFYLLLIFFLFPPSLIVWFLFFVFLGALAAQIKTAEEKIFDLSEILPLHLGVGLIWAATIIILGYFLGRAYASEIYFKKALDGFVKNDAKIVYDNMREAIILNPYIERYRLNFSQVNLLIANNIAAKAGQPQGKDKKPYELTEQDRQNISQAIQAAINHAKDAIKLNPQIASHWENLAIIYRNIITTAQGADVWTISSYQRAIILDPQNPLYRLNLGGVYYSLNNYEEAVKLFEQAVALKPDWANAYYNLAWTDYKKGNYQRAVSHMQNVISLLDPKKDKTDYEKAQKELEEFKKKLPQEEQKATESAQPTKLSLPTPVPATLEPKIRLPQTASPEAK